MTSSQPTPPCRLSPSCGRGSCSAAGRVPPSAGTHQSSGVSVKYCVPGSWGEASSGARPCRSSRAPALALAVSWRCALWCDDSARAIATAIRSCPSHERRRRSLRRRALPLPTPPPRSHPPWRPLVLPTRLRKMVWCVWCVCGVYVVCMWCVCGVCGFNTFFHAVCLST